MIEQLTAMHLYNIDGKFLEIIVNLIYEQNIQLLDIICQEEELNILKIQKLIPNQFELKKQLLEYISPSIIVD